MTDTSPAPSPAAVTWAEFERQAPDLAAGVRTRFEAHKHKTMATLRADGAPRLCGTEVEFWAGRVWLGGMSGNQRFADLRRDPRVAVHSGSDEPDTWTGDARIEGLAAEVTDPQTLADYRAGREVPEGPFELFVVDLTGAMQIRMDDGREFLWIDSWRPGREVRSVQRH